MQSAQSLPDILYLVAESGASMLCVYSLQRNTMRLICAHSTAAGILSGCRKPGEAEDYNESGNHRRFDPSGHPCACSSISSLRFTARLSVLSIRGRDKPRLWHLRIRSRSAQRYPSCDRDPELMHHIDEVWLHDWDTAWDITTRTFNYMPALLPEGA